MNTPSVKKAGKQLDGEIGGKEKKQNMDQLMFQSRQSNEASKIWEDLKLFISDITERSSVSCITKRQM